MNSEKLRVFLVFLLLVYVSLSVSLFIYFVPNILIAIFVGMPGFIAMVCLVFRRENYEIIEETDLKPKQLYQVSDVWKQEYGRYIVLVTEVIKDVWMGETKYGKVHHFFTWEKLERDERFTVLKEEDEKLPKKVKILKVSNSRA